MGEKHEKIPYLPGVEKAFGVMPKNPEAIKVMVNKYKHTEMKL